jgi:hypothetical protein
MIAGFRFPAAVVLFLPCISERVVQTAHSILNLAFGSITCRFADSLFD